MGIPELVAKRYEGKLRNNNILISAHSDNDDEIDRARDIFEKAGAGDICSTSDASLPSDEREDEGPSGRGRPSGNEPEMVETGSGKSRTR
jgi:hypothetical protein